MILDLQIPGPKHVLLALTGLVLGEECAAQPAASAVYEVRFESTWSSATHPVAFPGNAHFSGLIGGTHDDRVAFWTPGALASEGIESMAETGQKGALTEEVEAAIGGGTAEFVLSGGGINPSPGEQSLTFEISADKALVTLVSMVAPSPDWFVGVHGLNMIEDNDWRDTVTVTLEVFDAGTDSGTTYEAPNDDTDPAEPIAVLNVGPFAENATVGSYTFVRQKTVGTAHEEIPGEWKVSGPFPNPSAGRFRIDLSGALSEPVTLTVYDVTGRTVHRSAVQTSSTGQSVSVDISSLSEGFYVIRAVDKEHSVTRSAIVVK